MGKMVSWKIDVPEAIRDRYCLIANMGGVPVDRLVSFVLEDWSRKNRSLIAEESIANRLKHLMTPDTATGKPK